MKLNMIKSNRQIDLKKECIYVDFKLKLLSLFLNFDSNRYFIFDSWYSISSNILFYFVTWINQCFGRLKSCRTIYLYSTVLTILSKRVDTWIRKTCLYDFQKLIDILPLYILIIFYHDIVLFIRYYFRLWASHSNIR